MHVTVDDAVIDVEIAGKGDAIVLIHGFPFTRDIWDDQARELARDALVIRPDLRGMGRSNVPQGPYLMETLAGDIAAVLDAIGVERASIVGHSLGGYAGMAFCRMYTERVERLTLVCSRLQGDTLQAAQSREELAERAEREGIDVVIDAYFPRLFAASTVSRAPAVIDRAREIARRNDARGAAAMLRGMAQRVDSNDIAEELLMPVLILAGAHDVVPAQESESMARAFPNARLHRLEASGHVPMMEEPGTLTRLLDEFLRAGS
ncbi:MAG TPA: alpha/beta hydrolase [Candidatus Baltobacteraceae bacterium]|jgi:pimeloyl-ACP methyl ester carboxylesterase|nr:alpha/beta hydrolase [Candidatus Baltobacteraceae bacterium]